MKKRKRTLTPKLRFPEFRDGECWREVAVRETATVIAGQSPRGEYYNDTGNGTPFYQGKTDFGDVLINPATKWTTQVTKLALEDDILMSVRAPVGALNVSTQKICIGRGLAALRAKEDKWFLYYLLLQVNRLFIGNGGSVFDSINKSQIESTQIPFPPKLAEQQKIADCLSSLDGLIAAEGRKLEALKAHKKGLMQQLFPQPGETKPRLRFPEFRDKGEWSYEELSELVDVIDGDRGTNYPKADEFSDSGFCIFLNAKNVTKNGFKFEELQFITKSKDELLRKGKLKLKDIILTTRGSVGHFAYFTKDVPYENMRINSGMVILRVKSKEIDPDYLYAFSNSAPLTMHIEDISFGNAQQQLTVAGIKKLPIYYPELAEQQRIAACLTALDTRIAAQAAKIETLKTHKRGLMQQLFPAPENDVS